MNLDHHLPALPRRRISDNSVPEHKPHRVKPRSRPSHDLLHVDDVDVDGP